MMLKGTPQSFLWHEAIEHDPGVDFDAVRYAQELEQASAKF